MVYKVKGSNLSLITMVQNEYLKAFIEQYGKHIVSYKEYDNGVIRVKFADRSKIMWLKGRFCDIMDMQPISHTRRTYWFN